MGGSWFHSAGRCGLWSDVQPCGEPHNNSFGSQHRPIQIMAFPSIGHENVFFTVVLWKPYTPKSHPGSWIPVAPLMFVSSTNPFTVLNRFLVSSIYLLFTYSWLCFLQMWLLHFHPTSSWHHCLSSLIYEQYPENHYPREHHPFHTSRLCYEWLRKHPCFLGVNVHRTSHD